MCGMMSLFLSSVIHYPTILHVPVLFNEFVIYRKMASRYHDRVVTCHDVTVVR